MAIMYEQVRVNRWLHRQIKDQAVREGTSIREVTERWLRIGMTTYGRQADSYTPQANTDEESDGEDD